MEQTKCFKCGSTRFVIKHHTSYNPEVVVDCCRSCHSIIHHGVRKEGKCKYTVKQVERLSMNSSNKRSISKMNFTETLMPQVLLYEQIEYNKSTGNVYVYSWIHSNNGIQIHQEDI